MEELLKLTDSWYQLVSKDHHKDRDCHFYIEQRWSYGQEPKWYVNHFGYLAGDIEKGPYETYEEAAEALKKVLKLLLKKVDITI